MKKLLTLTLILFAFGCENKNSSYIRKGNQDPNTGIYTHSEDTTLHFVYRGEEVTRKQFECLTSTVVVDSIVRQKLKQKSTTQ